MSRFEFVSVAVALLYSIGVGRLLTSIPDVFEQGRRYWVHAAWVMYLLLFSAYAWWGLFDSAQGHQFTPLSFLATLCPPAFVIVRAQLLLGDQTSEIRSYRDQFYEKRVSFFSVGLASMLLLWVAPWIMGRVAYGEISPFQLRTLPFVLVWVVGIATSRPTVHAGLVCVMLPLAVVQFLTNVNSSIE